ncbi:MAG: hypothetical protein AB7O52_18965 [Planctomycetota bacterium]
MNARLVSCEECIEAWLDHAATADGGACGEKGRGNGTARDAVQASTPRGEHESNGDSSAVAEMTSAAVTRHLRECASCREEIRALGREQAALRRYFGTVTVPPPPPALRGALQAASGYPRRTSLTVMPTLIALLLLALLGVAALGWVIAQHLLGGS